MRVNNFKCLNNISQNTNINNVNVNKQKNSEIRNNQNYRTNDQLILPQDKTRVSTKVIPFVDNKNVAEINSSLNIETNKSQEKTLDDIVKDLSKYFDKSGKILASTRKELADKVLELLQDEKVRRSLINNLGLNTSDNIDRLLVTMCVEADDGFRGYPKKNLTINDPISVRENIFPLGATVINRFLSSAIIDATSHYSKNGNLEKFKAKTFEEILTEPKQIAYGATSIAKRKSMINFMKDNSTYDLHREVARELMSGKVNFELRVQEKIKDKETSKTYLRETKKIVNAGNFFHYASPADKIQVINEKLPWTKTPNGHRFAIYPPKVGKEQSIYFIGKNNGRNINWNK